MAAPKLVIKNSAGTTQIDETYRNFGFREIISVPFATATPFNYELAVGGGEGVLIAARSASLAACPLQSYISGSTWYFTFRIVPPFEHGVVYSETIQFYVFDLPHGTFSNFGIRIVHQGNVVFHTDVNPMKVPGASVQTCNLGYTGVSGRIYAPLVLLNPIRSEFTPGFGYGVSTRRLRYSGSNIISTDYFTGYGGFTSNLANEGLYAAVDVTGL